MDNFKNIQVGDKVYIQKPVTWGWGRSKRFTVKTKVVRLTAKFFAVEGEDELYAKADGKKRGTYGVRAEKEGVDQTQERREFIQRCNQVNKLTRLANKVAGIAYDTELTSAQIAEAIEALKKVVPTDKQD